MASLAEVNALGEVMDDVNAIAASTFVDLLREFTGIPRQSGAQSFWDILFWDIITPAALQMDALAEQFYLEDREAQGLFTPPPALPGTEVDEQRVWSLAGWTRSILEDEGRLQEAISKGSGGLQRNLFDRQRDTTMELAAADGSRYQRVAMPGCCAFCAMLASRGMVYASQEAAEKVVGRGVPIAQNYYIDENGREQRRRGGRAGGIKARGTRPLGEDYHDACRCKGVAVHGGNVQELTAQAATWFDIYSQGMEKAKGKFEQGHEVWRTFGTDIVNGREVKTSDMQSRSFWLDDRTSSATYGDEVSYGAIQKELLADMRHIAKDSYGLAMA